MMSLWSIYDFVWFSSCYAAGIFAFDPSDSVIKRLCFLSLFLCAQNYNKNVLNYHQDIILLYENIYLII